MGKGLAGQVAVVTGASRGIGRAIAQGLAQCGASLCLIGRDTRVLENAAVKPRGDSAVSRCYRADLTVDADIDRLVADVHADFDRVDVLVLSAGLHYMGSIEATPVEQLDELYRANVRGPYRLIRSLLPALKAAQGQIVFINSSVGLKSKAQVAHFAATQHAVRAIADGLRDEVNASGVRVLSVYPGRTATPRTEVVFEKEGKEYRPELLLQPEDIAEVVTHALQLPRTAELTDLSIRPMAKSY